MARKSSSIITFAGLFLALPVPVFYNLTIRPFLIADQTNLELEIIIGLIVMWMLAIGVVLLTIRAENRGLHSIGFTWPSRKIIFQALGLGVVFSLAVPLLSLLTSTLLPSEEIGSIESATQIPWWLMLFSVLTAGVTEEILFRGYALERLFEWTGSKWFSSFISLAFFTAVHATGWNLNHIVGVVIPLGVVLIALYWWRRNVIMVMIVHTMINLPLVFMALGRET
ncbi:CPBP family intramembrane metalloprotease [Aliifodinibius sp. S!AR15-10]|nr:CPBP family intramembrane metalloprotease [Aliifodinibius sp. S!AR15-10]